MWLERWKNEPARVVNDVLDNSPNVTVTFREVEGAEKGRVFVQVSVRFELGERSDSEMNELFASYKDCR